MDYRPTFYLPSTFVDGLAEKTTQNKNEIAQFERSITPELAQNMVDISKTYPTLDKRLVVYTALSGVQSDDSMLLELAQKQEKAMEKKQRINIKTNVNPLKRGTQLGFLAMDSAFQNISKNFKASVVAAQATDTSLTKAVIGNTLSGLVPGDELTEQIRKTTLGSEFNQKYNEAKDAYGETEFKRALGEIQAGKPLNLGVGFLPNSIALEDTDVYVKQIKLGKSPTEAYNIAAEAYGRPITEEFERDEYQFNYVTKSGEKIPISPGRVVAAQFSQEGDIQYALASTIIDGAFRLGADPINLLLGYGAAIKTAGRKVVSATEVAQYTDDAAFLTRALNTFKPTKQGKEARRLTFGKTAEQVMNSKWGDKFVDAMVQNDSIARLRDIPTLRKVDVRVLDLFTKIKNKDAMKEVLTTLLKNGDLSGITTAPYTGAVIGDDLARAAIETPITKLPMRQSVVAELSNQIAKKFAGASTDIAPLRKAIGGLLSSKDDPFRGLIGIGGTLKNALPQKVTRLFDLAPSRFASISYLNETIENIDAILVTAKQSAKVRDDFTQQLLDATTQRDIETIVMKLNKRLGKEIIKENPDLVGDEKLIDEVFTFVNNEIAEKRKYMYDSDGKALAFPGTKFDDITQQVVDDEIISSSRIAVPTAFSLGQFTENFVPLVDYKELGTAFSDFRRLVGPSDSKLNKYISKTWNDPNRGTTEKIIEQLKVPKTTLKQNYQKNKKTLAPPNFFISLYDDYIMQRILKPLWMIRPALATRVPGEESLRIAFYGGPNVFTHPLLLASMKSKPQKLLTKNDPTIVELTGGLGEQLFATRILSDEIDEVAELLGTEFMQKNIANLKYDEIQQIIKTLRLNTNMSGQVGDSFLQNAIDGKDATTFAYDEIVGQLKTLGTQPYNSRAAQTLTNNIELRDIPSVLPFVNLTNVVPGNISVIPNKLYRQVFDVTNNDEMRQAIQSYTTNPEIQKQLTKKNHNITIQKAGSNLIMNVSMTLNTGANFDRGLKNALSIAIKAHTPKIYIRKDLWAELPPGHPIKNVAKELEDVYEIRVYPQPDARIDNTNFESIVNKEIMEYVFEQNFEVARKIVQKKGGYANAAPSGSFFNTDRYYVETMANSTLAKALRPQGRARNAAADFYIMVNKYEPGSTTINPDYYRGFFHEILNKSKDPLFVTVARDGADKAFDYFKNNPQGKKYIQELINRSDDPDVRAVLNNDDKLLSYIKATEYEIARLSGANKKILRGGREISEQDAREIVGLEYPDYESDIFGSGGQTIRNFIANGGYVNGEDYVELSQKYAINSSGEKYISKFYEKLQEVFKQDLVDLDLGPRNIAFNNNPSLTRAGATIDTAVKRWDDVLQKGYNTFLTRPSDFLNRDPFFRWSFYTLAEDIMPYMTQEVKEQFVVGAKTWVDGSDLYKNLVRKSKLPSEENTITSLEQAETLLKYKAMEEVRNLLYASSNRHVLSDVMASYVPFPEIWQEVIKTWGKLLAENPQKFNRTRIAVDRGKEAKPWDTDNAFFTTDPVTGELLFNYVDVMHVASFGLTALPGAFGFKPLQSGLLGSDLEDEGVRVRPYGFLEGLNLISANGFSPGFGPIVTFPFKVLTKIATAPKVLTDFILGNFEQPGSQPNLINELPAWAKGYFKAIPFTQEATEEINASYSKTVMDLFTLYYYAGKWTPDDEQSVKLAMQEAERAAAMHWLIRGTASAAFPTSIQPRYEIKDKNGAWWTMQVLGQKYQQMLEANQYDYYVTSQQFIQRFGLNPIPLRQSSTVKKGRFPVKKESYAFWQKTENKELLERKPYTAIHLFPDKVDDEFSLPAFMAGGEVLDPTAYERATKQSLLQFELENIKEELNNDKTLTSAARKERYSAIRAEKEQEYGVISYGRLGDAVEQADKYQIILELRDWKNEPLLAATPEYPILEKFIEEYDRAIDVVLNGGEFRGVRIKKGGIPGKTAATLSGTSPEIADIRTELDAYARELALQNEDTEWISIYLGSFWKELDNRRYLK